MGYKPYKVFGRLGQVLLLFLYKFPVVGDRKINPIVGLYEPISYKVRPLLVVNGIIIPINGLING